jgi:hypothetical protein
MTTHTRANRFKKGSGVYTCQCCGRQTRDTGGDGSGVGSCDLCYDLAGFENLLEDSSAAELTKREIETIIANVETVYERGGKRGTWDDLLAAVIDECRARIENGETK